MSINARVRDLEARDAIVELRHSYAAHLDACRWEKWSRLFAESAIFRVDEGDGRQGRETIRRYARESIDSSFEYSHHRMSNPRIDIDGDSASGHWYVDVFFALPDGTAGWHCGEYDDRYVYEDGRWVFEEVSVRIHAETDDRIGYTREEDGQGTIRIELPESGRPG